MRWTARLRLLRLLNLAPLLRRPMRAVLTVVAIGAGASLLCGVLVEQHSFTASINEFAAKLAGPTPLRVVGPSSHGGIPDDVVTRVRGVDGVRAAVPIVETVVRAGGPAGGTQLLALGVDCSATAIVGSFQCSPAALAHARPGRPPLVGTAVIKRLTRAGAIRTDVGRIPLAHAGALPALDKLNGGLVAIFPLPQAQQEFVRAGQVDAIYVLPAPGTDVAALEQRLQRALPVQDRVLRATDPPTSAADGNVLTPLLGLIALVALGVAALLVYNIVSLSVAERRRELAVASALGATPRVTVGGVLAEAAVQGAVGGALGAAAGVAIAAPLVAAMSAQTEMFSGIHLHVHVNLTTLLAGPLIGVVTAVAAAWAPARRASRVDVAGELHARSRADVEAPRSVRRLAALLAVGGAGLVACFAARSHAATAQWQPPVGSVGLLAAIVAFTAATLSAAPLVVNALRPWSRRRGGVIDLAVRTLSSQPRRTGVAATAVAAAVAFSTMLVAAMPAIDAATVQLFSSVVDGRVYVSTLDFNNTAAIDSKPSPRLRQQLARLPGVAAVDADMFVAAPVDGDRTYIAADEGPTPRFTVVAGTVDPRALARGEVFVGPAVARRHHLRPGSTVSIDTPAGRVRLRVAAIWLDPDSVGTSLTMSPAKLTAMFGPQPPTALFVQPAPGHTADEVAATIRAAHLDEHLVVQPPKQWFHTMAASVRSMMAPFWTLQKTLLLVALVATLSTLLLVGVQRRHELGTLGALGLGPRSLAMMTLAEAAIVGLTGCVLGIAVGAVTGIGMMADAVFVMGASPPFRFDPVTAAAYAGLALLVVVAGATWPAWRISRLQVVAALRHE